MNSSHRGLLQRPAWLQWEGKKGEKGPPKQGAAGRYNRTAPRALLSQPLSACASLGHSAKLVLDLVREDQIVRNQADECIDRHHVPHHEGTPTKCCFFKQRPLLQFDYLSPYNSTGNTVQKDVLWRLGYFAN